MAITEILNKDKNKDKGRAGQEKDL